MILYVYDFPDPNKCIIWKTVQQQFAQSYNNSYYSMDSTTLPE